MAASGHPSDSSGQGDKDRTLPVTESANLIALISAMITPYNDAIRSLLNRRPANENADDDQSEDDEGDLPLRRLSAAWLETIIKHHASIEYIRHHLEEIKTISPDLKDLIYAPPQYSEAESMETFLKLLTIFPDDPSLGDSSEDSSEDSSSIASSEEEDDKEPRSLSMPDTEPLRELHKRVNDIIGSLSRIRSKETSWRMDYLMQNRINHCMELIKHLNPEERKAFKQFSRGLGETIHQELETLGQRANRWTDVALPLRTTMAIRETEATATASATSHDA